jgi:hypothetical protein
MDVERVARALCSVDGRDPDDPVETGGVHTQRADNEFVSEPVEGPLWHMYREKAERFVAAYEALSAAG